MDSGSASKHSAKLQSDPRPHFENLLDPMSLVPEIAPDRVEVAPLAADVRGAEISLVSEGHELNWWLGLAWSEALDSLGGTQVPRSWDQTWAATAALDWIRGNWRFGAVAGSHRGWPTTRVDGSELGSRNADRFPIRATLDLRAEYRKPLSIREPCRHVRDHERSEHRQCLLQAPDPRG